MPRARKQKPDRTVRRSTQRTRKAINWVMGARAYLYRMAKQEVANCHYTEAYDLAFASRMILDCWNIGEPGLLVGMFYTPDWRSWRDITAQNSAKVGVELVST